MAKQFNNILDVDIRKLKNKNLESFASLKNIRRLFLIECKLTSLNGVELLNNLRALRVAACSKLTDFNALPKSKSLRYIWFGSIKKFRDWNFLGKMNNLEVIILEVANDINFIRNLRNLKYFQYDKIIDKNISILKDKNLVDAEYPADYFFISPDQLN